MKSAAVALAAVALAATLADAAADVCALDKLQELMATPFTLPCITESGLEFGKLSGAPTSAQVQGFCSTAACASLLKAVLAKNPPDCTIPAVNLKFRSELFDPLAKACAGGAMGNATSNSNSTSSANENTAANSTVGNNLDGDADVAKAANSTSDTPAPTPKKSAAPASFAVSVCATAFAVASAMALML